MPVMTTPIPPTRAPAPDEDPRPQLHVVQDAMVTDREIPIGSSDLEDAAAEAPTRDARVHARASLAANRPVTQRIRAAQQWLVRVWAWGRPPDLWATDRPSLRKQLNYALWGEQHPDSGPLRALSVAICCLGLVPQALAYYVAWAAERPGRLLSLYVLLAVLMQIPVVRVVVTAVVSVLIAPLAWL
jgi:hypothetical protein